MRKILKAAIKIGGKVYTGKHHDDAIEKASADGKDISKVDKEKDGLFLVNDGSLITREQAGKEFGITHSHEIGLKGKYIIVTQDFRLLGIALLDKENEIIFAKNPNMDEFDNQPKEFWEGYNLVGENIAQVLDLDDVMARREEYRDYTFIWDGNHDVKENEILRKEGFDVALGGELPDKLENNRPFAIETAEKYGLPSPMWDAFKKKEAGIEYLQKHPDIDFVFKPNGGENYLTTVLHGDDARGNNEIMQKIVQNYGIDDFVLQEKKPGIEVNIEIFFQDGKPMSASMNLEVKRILAGDSGKMCGCAFDVMKDIPLDCELVKMTMEKMIPFYEKENYTGFADCNVIIGYKKKDIWFLENCCRIGINAHINYFLNIENKGLCRTLGDLARGKYKPDVNNVWGASLTCYAPKQKKGTPITIPEDMKSKVFLFDGYKENKDDDTILETGYGDDLLVICDKDFDIKSAMQKVLNMAERLVIPNLGFRNDGAREDYTSSPFKRYSQLKEMGYI